ncbi:hypothetical protein BATDEDRAFT_89697 [Batrachochytrium dendrobatidis JAM81]|uniref:Uncharacterized protein n=1 Tax=Batrachochytrium dendrobatidis (strain JAM81 / FGSC 10211) TaxID=684364 RepID=F4P6E0_BATDJ|nr:uncharacterized protein BATDEDRAFT_89697 [Batrachochytrium dendrobatidis JAM81]EGF79592.1 hypothetical protein BATDEDRAFT_89697 [Batrachochytrium dendrobatidis JAM81]KAJ8323057.1 hypothetical protein O5D80_008565 [Batrachochytrium dendrobatidis]KAK5665624.1 hypothetical protein QVD99_007273 [Batrachochytrium dendrobatidis]|eukprot:XP_006680216.1 hypothetical protein BATDEDRAFT_89697 [Batrachochytrium dendrobatidis JAM81]
MRLSSIFYLLGLALTTVSAETACTGIYCGCELGYCWKANSAVNPTSFRVDRFCERTEDCLKGCVDGYCQVADSSQIGPVITDIQCARTSDCYHYIPTVQIKH